MDRLPRPAARPPESLDGSDELAWLRLLGQALDSTTNGIVLVSNTPGRPILYCNDAFERLTGYARAEILGRNCRFLQGDDTDPEAVRRMRAAFEAGEAIDLVIRNYRRDGTAFWNALNIGPLRSRDGVVTHFVGIQTDVTERMVLQRQLEEQVLRDPLTGLPNRTHFMRDLERDAAQLKSQGRFAVAFIDLDGFKTVNDILGHAVGDALLQQVGERLQAAVRGTDLVARLAGDEFVAVLRGIVSEDGLALVGERVHQVFRSAFVIAGTPVMVRASIGVVRHVPGESATDLLTRADQCMSVAKRGGRDPFVLG